MRKAQAKTKAVVRRNTKKGPPRSMAGKKTNRAESEITIRAGTRIIAGRGGWGVGAVVLVAIVFLIMIATFVSLGIVPRWK